MPCTCALQNIGTHLQEANLACTAFALAEGSACLSIACSPHAVTITVPGSMHQDIGLCAEMGTAAARPNQLKSESATDKTWPILPTPRCPHALQSSNCPAAFCTPLASLPACRRPTLWCERPGSPLRQRHSTCQCLVHYMCLCFCYCDRWLPT